MTQSPGLGWLRESAESRSVLHARAMTFSVARAFTAPPVIDHRGWRKDHIEDQGDIGSCVGHQYSSAGEVLTYIDTQGVVQDKYNRMACYVWAQQEDGISGKQAGAMVSGAMKAAKRKGFALESLWPYNPARYSQNVPQAVIEDGLKRLLIGQHAVLRSYQECFDWLASGAGVILIGMPVQQSFVSNKTGVINGMSGSVVGGHALLLHGYSDRRAFDGRQHIICENSWGTRWGANGFCEFSPSMIDWMCRGINKGHEVIGITDIMDDGPIEPRPFDWMTYPNI
jgi:C1A family cysteine protease